jgi:chromosome segregation ATPase
MKKCVRTTVLVIVVLYCWKNTSIPSYVATIWSQTKKDVQAQVPTSFKIDHIQQLIDSADGDVSNMIRLFAEHKVSVNSLRKEVQTAQDRRDKQKAELLQMTQDLEGNPKSVFFNGIDYSPEQLRAKLQRDFESYKRLENHLQTQKDLLDAEESSLKATEEQLAGIMAKQGEYKVRLARLKANEKNLQVTRLANPLPRDNGKALLIDAEFDEVERDLDVQREVIAKTKEAFSSNVAVSRGKQPTVDTANIRRYLETPSTLAAGSKVGKN